MHIEKAVSISQIKQAVQTMPAKQLHELVLRLARFKKDNNDMLTYLIFQADDTDAYINEVNETVTAWFLEMNKSNVYLIKKTVRKTIRLIDKKIKFAALPKVTVEICMHWCQCFLANNFHKKQATVLDNLYISQVKKMEKAYNLLHPDVQMDYSAQMQRFIK
ncbi:MAG: hypothetical protein JNK61_05495 [Bacteroidia bacterium]|nr:hypothetical protein [Bacteroidia bacterium]